MSDQDKSVIDMKGIAEPVTKLIDALSKAIGTVYEPTHLRRMAKAKAEVKLIETRSNIDKEDIKKRAANRLIHRETLRQQNIEKISEQAFSELPNSANNVPPDETWMSEFFNLCQDVSDEELQILWARTLAGEVSQPGRYSLRSMQLLKTLNSREANLFYDFCSTICCFKGDSSENIYARIVGVETNEFLYRNMDRMDLIHLAELGLVSYKEMNTLVVKGLYQEFNKIDYFHHSLVIEENFSTFNPMTWLNWLRPRKIEMEFLTELGTELLSVARGEYNVDYLAAVKSVLKFSGIKSLEPL